MIEPKTTDMTDALKFIFEGSWPVIGDEFFRALVRHLAVVLGVRYVYITECTDSTRTRVRTIASWMGEDFGENVEYDLAGTPCEKVMKGNISYYPKDVQALFPRDEYFVTLGVQSYLGIPFFDSSNKLIGHMGILDTKPMNDDIQEMSILKVFATRAGIELERKHTEVELKKYRDHLEELVDQKTRALKTTNEQLQQKIIERKQAEEILLRQSAILETTTDFVAYADLNRCVLYVNSAGRKMVGLNETGDLLKLNIDDYHPGWVNKQLEKEIFPQCVRKGSWEGELALITRDGHEIPVSAVITSHRNSNGEVYLLSTIMRDITERKCAEKKLRMSEEKYRGLTESLGQLVYRANPDTLVATYVNCAIKKIYGYTAEKWLKNSNLWEKAIHPDDKERVITVFMEAQKKVEDNCLEYRIIKKDGSIRHVEDHFTWEKDEQGRVISLNGVVYDITKRKQAEEELQSINEQLDAVIFNMPIGVAILEGPEFRYAKINRTLADINGPSVEDHIGRPLAEVIPQAAKDIIPRLRKVWKSNKTSPQYEFCTRLPKDPNHAKYFLDSFFFY